MSNLGTLYFYEIKKLLKRKLVWIMLTVCMAVSAATVLAGIIGFYYEEGKKVDTNYHVFLEDMEYERALDGRKIDDGLLGEMSAAYGKIPDTKEEYSSTEEYQKYARPYSAIFGFVRDATHMTVSEAMDWTPDEADLYAKRRKMLEEEWEAEYLTDGEKQYWRQMETGVETPFTYEIMEGWWMLLRAAPTIGLMVILSVYVCLSGMFADEHAKRTDQLILCSRYGRKSAYWAKILSGISCAAAVFVICSGTAFGLTFAIYGTEGIGAGFQLIFTEYSCPLTMGEAVLILYGCMLACALICSVFAMFLSEALGSGVASLACTVGMLLLSMIIQIPAQYRVLAQLWDWLPNAFFSLWNVFDVRLLPVFGEYLMSWEIVPILYVAAGIVIAVTGKMIYRRYQVSGR